MKNMVNLKKKRFRVSMLAGLLLLLLVSFHGPEVQAATKIKGIDVSQWQGTVDWAKVKKSGVKFVMLGIGRLNGSTRAVDPKFTYNIKNAIANDIKVGVYLYSKATTTAQAKKEAQFVLDVIDGYKISYPVAFDIEDAIQQKLTNKKRTDITIAFLEVIEEAGYYPMIYASESWFKSSMDLSRLTKYDKWVANWSSKVSLSPTSMWQYSSKGKVSGISTNVDLDYSYKDYSKLITPRTAAKVAEVKVGWQNDGTHYWYIQKDGTRVKNGFKTIDGKKYYFDESGYRVTGWKKISGKYYYFSKKGVMQTGWLKVSGKYYYLNKSGVRQTGWVKVDGYKYYLNKSGVRQTGWLKLNGKKYFLNLKTGRMRTGWLTYQGKTYYFSTQTGQMRTGWLTFGTKKYYIKSDGNRASGWTKIKGKWYYFNKKDGVMKKNCKVGKYKFDKNGVCANYK